MFTNCEFNVIQYGRKMHPRIEVTHFFLYCVLVHFSSNLFGCVCVSVEVDHVSVMVNVSHSVLHCMEAWGTEPSFSWLHEKVAVTEKVGHVSADGATLIVSGTFCGHFTCVVSNKLGHSSATYTAGTASV